MINFRILTAALSAVLVVFVLTPAQEDVVYADTPINRLPISSSYGQDVIAERVGIRLKDYDIEILFLFLETRHTSFISTIDISATGKYGVRNSQNRLIIPREYDEILTSGNASFWVRKGQEWSLFDEKGQRVSELSFRKVNTFYEGKSVVLQGEKWGVINSRCQWVIPPSYDFADSRVSEGILAYEIKGKWGYINTSGKILSPPLFDGATGFDNGIAIVQKGNYCAIIRNNMDMVTKYEFDYAFKPSNGLVPVCVNGKWGYVDENGKMSIQCIYDFALRFREGVGYVLKNGDWFLIYSNGNVVPLFTNEKKRQR